MKRNAVSIVVDDVTFPGAPGAISFAYGEALGKPDEILGMRHCCPCGCGQWGWMNFEGYGFPKFWSPQPKKGDDLSKLTLTPSIGFMKDTTTGQYHWHGYLKNGIFEEC